LNWLLALINEGLCKALSSFWSSGHRSGLFFELERQALARHALERQALARHALERQALARQALERQEVTSKGGGRV
jgi:hypothetical protein